MRAHSHVASDAQSSGSTTKPSALLVRPAWRALDVELPDAPLEREARRLARDVMAGEPVHPADGARSITTPAAEAIPRVQRCSGQCGGTCAQCRAARARRASHDEPFGSPLVSAAAIGPGEPLSTAAQAFFEPRFGFDFSRVRIHSDKQAGAAAQQLHARAFTIGRDIVFGAGQYAPNDDAGRHLLAHELAHVVQQSGAPSRPSGPRIQRAPENGAGATTAGPASVPGVGNLIIDDASEPAPGQMHKTAFLAALRPAVEAAVATTVGADQRGWAQRQIDNAFRSGARRSAAEVERGIREQVSEASSAQTASDYISAITRRVRRTVSAPSGTGMGRESGEGPPVLRKVRTTGGVNLLANPVAIRARLGHGRPLESRVQARMESAFGTSFAHVRLHTGARAATLSERLDARAFAVGEHIAFGSGEYRPGTEAGDTLLAHELAHVAQQDGRSSNPGATPDQTLEHDADAAAESVIGRLFGGARQRRRGERTGGPHLRTGLRVGRREKTVQYRFQNISGFDVCIYCACTEEPEAIRKHLEGPLEKCPPGMEIVWAPGSCDSWSQKSKRFLSSDPCPDSGRTCQ